MKRLILIVALALAAEAPVYSQHPPTGFYMVIENQSNCPNLAYTLTGEKMFCLPKEPIITESEIESVGDVVSDKAKGQKFFDLRLSPAGFKTFTTLAGRLPDSKVALVIGGHVSGIYESKGKINNRILTVRGEFDSPDIEWMHDKVKKK